MLGLLRFFIGPELVEDFVLVEDPRLLVVVTPLEPAVLVETLAVEQHEAQAGLVVRLVDALGDLPQVHCEHFVAGHCLFLFLIHQYEVAES